MKIYVGNLSFDTTEESLGALFSNDGQIDDCAVITDRETGRPRNFAFVTMPDDQANAAIEALDGTQFEARRLNVNEVRPRPTGWGKRQEGWQPLVKRPRGQTALGRPVSTGDRKRDGLDRPTTNEAAMTAAFSG